MCKLRAMLARDSGQNVTALAAMRLAALALWPMTHSNHQHADQQQGQRENRTDNADRDIEGNEVHKLMAILTL